MSSQSSTPSVLILARDFPPYNLSLGGVVRVVKLAQFLELNGFQVFVVASKGEKISTFGYDELLSQLNVFYVEDAYQRYSTRKHLHGFQPRDSSGAGAENSYLSSLKRLILNYATPDLAVFFQRGLYKTADNLIRHHRIQNVIVSSPPHSTQLIGLRLKRALGERINLIIDYRDSWNTRKLFRKNIYPLQKVNEWLEASVLRQGDRLIYVSAPMLTKIDKKYRVRPQSAQLVMNGFDKIMIDADGLEEDHGYHPSSGPLTIGHFGSMSLGPSSMRDPSRFLDAIRNSDLPIKLIQYGYCNDPEYLSEASGGRVEVRGTLPHLEAVHAMKAMDVLLFLHSQREDSDEVVSGKIFDYMVAQRPILSVGPVGMEVCRIIRENRIGYCADLYDKEDIRNVILRLIEEKQSRRLISYDVRTLLQYSRQAQYAKILPLLRSS